jgi:hypothetical protein
MRVLACGLRSASAKKMKIMRSEEQKHKAKHGRVVNNNGFPRR